MTDYQVQDGCHNCAHVFDHNGLFCVHKAIRPPADSMEEMKRLGIEDLTIDQRRAYIERWMEWSFWHKVVPAGKCKTYQKAVILS